MRGKVKESSLKKSKKSKAKETAAEPSCQVKCHKKHLKFFHFGTKQTTIKVAVADELKKRWVELESFSIGPREGYFDDTSLTILDAYLINEGVLLLYFVEKSFSIGAVLLDQSHPEVLLWRTADPIYQFSKNMAVQKLVKIGRTIAIVVQEGKKTHSIKFSLNQLLGKLKRKVRPIEKVVLSLVQRSRENPIIQPKLVHGWECDATFNAAALYLAGQVHFIYRAIGSAGMSVFGYAASQNGIHIDERSENPVYIPKEPFEFRQESSSIALPNLSGGGWGGCEDPRLTKIDDTIYMTYTAFNGAEPPGVGLTSIKVEDFLNKRWNWRKAMLISTRGQSNKNWVIFPEKIQGKFAILHSISPEICIDYFDRLDSDTPICINSFYGRSLRYGHWDNHLRGVGPPPIKIDDGWLLLYHAMDEHDPNKYKLGAMMLDYHNPKNILYRSVQPILEPIAHYENQGYKSGVIYSCGVVVIGDQLFVYYGGADTVTCVATAKLSVFLEQLKTSQRKLIVSKVTVP